jgi:hypothetical protein
MAVGVEMGSRGEFESSGIAFVLNWEVKYLRDLLF